MALVREREILEDMFEEAFEDAEEWKRRPAFWAYHYFGSSRIFSRFGPEIGRSAIFMRCILAIERRASGSIIAQRCRL